MAVKTAEEYVESVRRLKPRVYVAGELVSDLVSHPNTRAVVNAIAKTYELACTREYRQVMTTVSPISGERVSRLNHVCTSPLDLEMRAQLAELTSRKTGTCNYRCVGCDAMNALAHVTKLVDAEKGTSYSSRLMEFIKLLQMEDLACSGALTDPKGDRRRRPAEQEDPDMYLRVVERRSDGIVVRGAKMHQSGAVAAHWTIVMPGLTLRRGEEDYAVAFAVPNGEKGVTYIFQSTSVDAERREAKSEAELGLPHYGVRETCMIVFDDVFIPWERVFLCGEVEYTGQLIRAFTRMHRMSAAACKVGFGDLIIGATSLAARYNGVEKAPHIVHQITEMVRLNETIKACSLAAAKLGEKMETGVCLPHEMFANVAKLNSALYYFEMVKAATDIAGGLLVTAPSWRDLQNPEAGKYIRKYLKTPYATAEERWRVFKFLQHWAAGPHAAETWHGGGSPAAQRMLIYQTASLEEKEREVLELAKP